MLLSISSFFLWWHFHQQSDAISFSGAIRFTCHEVQTLGSQKVCLFQFIRPLCALFILRVLFYFSSLPLDFISGIFPTLFRPCDYIYCFHLCLISPCWDSNCFELMTCLFIVDFLVFGLLQPSACCTSLLEKVLLVFYFLLAFDLSLLITSY